MFVLCLLATACQPVPSPTSEPSPSPSAPAATPTRIPTQVPSPTPSPLGSPENPLLMGIVAGTEAPDAATSAETFAQQLGAKTGLAIHAITSPSYETLLAALGQGKTHVAWLPPLTYLIASQRQVAEAALLTNHFGVYAYGTQFLANAASQFTPYFDPATNQSTADAAHALVQFAGKRPCWVDPTSASGYIVPLGILAQESIEALPGVITQEHTAVVRALYTGGICDFGATFAISGDPRTAADIQTDLPDVFNRVVVIWQTGAVIPNLNVSYFTGLTQAMRQQLNAALLDLVRDKGNQDLLSTALQYEVSGLQAVTDSAYDPLREIVNASQVDITPLIGK